jgi:dipeptidyl aminopeptidase/acylaminoacyl peptidase
LWAVAFDRERLIATTTPVPVVDSVGMKPLGGAPNFSVSETGSLVYVPGAAAASGLGQRTLAWVDRDGIPLVSSSQAPDDVLPTGDYTQVRLSPDGRWAALQLGIGGGTDIALIDFSTAIRTPFAADDGIDEVDPVWSPDGSRVAFSTNRGGEIRVKRVGSESHTVLLKHDGGGPVWLEDWSPDGQWLLYRIVNDVYGLSMEGEEVLLNDSPSVKDEFRFSPNGRRISYEESAASGRPEVFVVEFPTWANKRKVSSDGGGMARWTRGGRELVYVDLNSVLHSVDVGEGEETIEISRPIPLFDLPVVSARVGMDMYDVSLDGERFVNIESDGFDPPVEVVLNWDQELLERVPHP